MTNWRPSLRVQWLCWTVVFGLYFAGGVVARTHSAPPYPGPVTIVYLGLSLMAAFAIGVRFPYEQWVFGPPVALAATVLAVLVLPEWGPARPSPIGNMTQKDELVFMLVWGGWAVLIIVALVYATIARIGVSVGQRREEEATFREAVRSDVDLHSGRG